ncbi:MAG: zinc-binding dehydrogenase [Saprospiraceae bacterium]
MQRQSYQLKAGSIANLKLVTSELPDPVGDEVTIAVKAIGLNFADIFAMFGLYSATPKGTFIPGLEYAGEVIKIGPDTKTYKVGDKIMGVTRFGGYTSHLNMDEGHIMPLPDGWTFEEGAAYLVQVLTAFYGLKNLGAIRENYTILVHSAGGGVGILANRIAKKYGAYTIGTVGSAKKIDFVQKEGYDEVIVRNKSTFKKDLTKALDGRELNIVMECIGGSFFKNAYDIMAPEGRVIFYGAARYASPGSRPNYFKVLWEHLTRPMIDPQSMSEINKGILGFNLIYLYERTALMQSLIAELKDLDIGKPHVGHVFDFPNLKEAIKLFQTGQTIGKVVVKV